MHLRFSHRRHGSSFMTTLRRLDDDPVLLEDEPASDDPRTTPVPSR